MTATVYVAARRDRASDPLVGTLAFLDTTTGTLTTPGGRTTPSGPYVVVEVLAADAAEAVAEWVQANDSADDPVGIDEKVAERLLGRFCEGGPAATVTQAGWLHACAYWAQAHGAKEAGR